MTFLINKSSKAGVSPAFSFNGFSNRPPGFAGGPVASSHDGYLELIAISPIIRTGIFNRNIICRIAGRGEKQNRIARFDMEMLCDGLRCTDGLYDAPDVMHLAGGVVIFQYLI